MVTRRTLVTGAASMLLSPFITTSARAEQAPVPYLVLNTEPVAQEEVRGAVQGSFPGDLAHKHKLYHDPYYLLVFGELVACTCGTGDCRVTDWRDTKLGSPKGFDVVVARQWCALPGDVKIPDPLQIPKDFRKALAVERAHVCAYFNGGSLYIPCVIINQSKV